MLADAGAAKVLELLPDLFRSSESQNGTWSETPFSVCKPIAKHVLIASPNCRHVLWPDNRSAHQIGDEEDTYWNHHPLPKPGERVQSRAISQDLPCGLFSRKKRDRLALLQAYGGLARPAVSSSSHHYFVILGLEELLRWWLRAQLPQRTCPLLPIVDFAL